jgi:UDP-2-acetamido-3-amino-2,3-dideoxy-glucuronate N-acetyltransferase
MAADASVFVHEKALCESTTVGPRTRVWAFAHVMPGAIVGADCNIGDHVFIETGARIGDRVIVKNNALVWDKVTLEDDVFVGPNAVFTNDFIPRVAFKNPPEKFLPTLVRRGASIGANATIVCGVTIGEQAFVAAGAVVVRDVPAHAMVAGNPARRIGWMCACGKKLPATLACACGRSYRVADARAGLVTIDASP